MMCFDLLTYNNYNNNVLEFLAVLNQFEQKNSIINKNVMRRKKWEMEEILGNLEEIHKRFFFVQFKQFIDIINQFIY